MGRSELTVGRRVESDKWRNIHLQVQRCREQLRISAQVQIGSFNFLHLRITFKHTCTNFLKRKYLIL